MNKIEGGDIYLSSERWDNQKMATESFKPIFSGTILYAEADIDSGEENYLGKKRKEQFDVLHLPLLIGFTLLILLLALEQTSFLQAFNWQLGLLTLFKSTGLVTSLLLLWHSIDSNNPLIERLCTGENKNCNAILSSKAARVTDYLSWSEVGFFYYSGTWLVLLFHAIDFSMLQILAWLSICCLPYSFYSVYYQAKVAKQWCVFCMTIQALFWLEAITFIPTLLQPFQFPSFNTWIPLFICLMSPILLWIFIKPFLLESAKVSHLKTQLKKFKYNGKLFYKMLQEQEKQELLEEADTIILGNVEAENILTIVSNPYCQPCAKAHKLLNTWLAERDNFKLQVVFSTQNSNEDPKTMVARHLHRLNNENPKVLRDAVHDWYEHKYKGVEEWKKAYPVKQETDCPQLVKQMRWCEKAEVQATPTFFLNGHRLPSLWQLEDIKYMI